VRRLVSLSWLELVERMIWHGEVGQLFFLPFLSAFLSAF
jgi:hypothetical protein